MRKLQKQTESISAEIQSRMYEEAKGQQEAYALLQAGLMRYRESKEFLAKPELKTISPYSHKLVLSTQERWLLEQSKQYHEEQRRRQQRRYLKGAGLAICVALVLSIGATNLSWSSSSPMEDTEEPKTVAKKTPVPENTPPPVERDKPDTVVNQSPTDEVARVKNTSSDDQNTTEEEFREKGVAEKAVNPFSYTIPVETQNGKVLRVRKAGKWGLANTRYEVLLPLVYRRVRVLDTTRGYFILELGNKRGIANARGKVLLPPKYDKLGDYIASDHLLVVYEGEKAEVYNLRSGRPAIDTTVRSVSYFSEGLFGVQYPNGKWGFMDTEGDIVVPALYDAILQPFQDGHAIVQKDNEKFYLNQSGETTASLR